MLKRCLDCKAETSHYKDKGAIKQANPQANPQQVVSTVPWYHVSFFIYLSYQRRRWCEQNALVPGAAPAEEFLVVAHSARLLLPRQQGW